MTTRAPGLTVEEVEAVVEILRKFYIAMDGISTFHYSDAGLSLARDHAQKIASALALSALRREGEPVASKVAQRVSSDRDSAWVLAMAAALGSDSGYVVPIVPEPDPFRKLFAAVRAHPPSVTEAVEAAIERAARICETHEGIAPFMADGRNTLAKAIRATLKNAAAQENKAATAAQDAEFSATDGNASSRSLPNNPAAAAPSGQTVAVPMEPTREMIEAWKDACRRTQDGDWLTPYRAMLSAAPLAAAPGQGEK